MVLNILPIMLFAYTYLSLSNYSSELSFWLIVLAGLSSLSVFSPYRLYHLLIVGLKDSRFRLYDETPGNDDRPAIKQRLSGIRAWPTGHFLALVLYLIPLASLVTLAKFN